MPIDYVDSYGTSAAPSNGAGIWYGSDSITDGSFGYFIGHNYTDFGAVADLENGSRIFVTDADGNSREYEVVDSFVVPKGTYWSEVSDRVTGYGESIAMQTCVEGGGANCYGGIGRILLNDEGYQGVRLDHRSAMLRNVRP